MRLALALCAVECWLAAAPPQTPAPDFETLSRAAAAAVDSRPEQAVELSRKALALRPDWPQGWFYIGGALYRLKRYNEAVDAFQKGLKLDPTNGVAWAILGLSEHELGHSEGELEDIYKAEKLGLGSLNLETAVRQQAATTLIQASAFDRALAQLTPLARYSVNTPAIISLAGLCALTDARAPAEVPVARRPVVTLAGQALWSAISRKPSKDIEELFHKLIATYPKEPGVHYAYGLSLQNGADLNDALAEFQKEIAANPGHWPSLLASAFLLTRQNAAPEQALKAAEQAARSAPPAYQWLCDAEMGRALLAMDEPAKALPLLEHAAKARPDNPRTHFYLAKAYRRTGRKADAQKEDAEFLRLGAQQDPRSFPTLGDNPQP